MPSLHTELGTGFVLLVLKLKGRGKEGQRKEDGGNRKERVSGSGRIKKKRREFLLLILNLIFH